MILVATSDGGDSVPDSLDRQHAMALQSMIGRFLDHFDRLGEQVDASGIGQRIARGVLNLMNDVKSLAQHVSRVLSKSREQGERSADEGDRKTVAYEKLFHELDDGFLILVRKRDQGPAGILPCGPNAISRRHTITIIVIRTARDLLVWSVRY